MSNQPAETDQVRTRLPMKYRLRPRAALPWVNRRYDRLLAERKALWAEAYAKGWAERGARRG